MNIGGTYCLKGEKMGKLKLVNGKVIEDYTEPYIIAELGSNHNGNMELAERLIREAKEAGCDCVKFQSWTKDTIFSKKVYHENYFLTDDYRNRTDFTLEQIVDEFSISEKELLQMKLICDDIGIDCTSTPFSKKEVDFLVDKLNAPFIKVASMDLNNYPFLTYIAKKNVPIVLSTGLSDIFEIDKAIHTIKDTGNNQISLLHCISIYPPKMEDINLNNIYMLRKLYPNYPIGFSDHTIGVSIPLAAVTMGSAIIEKHFTLDKGMFGWDHKVSADYTEMSDIVKESKNIIKALGTTERIVSDAEKNKRVAFRRSIVAARNIKKGEIINEDMIDYKRPGDGISPEYNYFIIGKKSKRDIEYDEMIRLTDV